MLQFMGSQRDGHDWATELNEKKERKYDTHTHEYYSAIKKNEILLPAKTWMNLEGIILSEMSQRKTNTV